MRGITWRLTEWYLGRHLTRPQADAALGDLAEDFAVRQRTQGRRRAALWLMRESASLVTAYRSQIAGERWRSRRTIMGETWMADARLAARRLSKRPGATVASILTLACSIAAAGLTWTVLSAVLVRPLPVESPDRLMSLARRYLNPDGNTAQVFLNRRWTSFDYPTYLDIRESGIFESVIGSGSRRLLIAESTGAAAVERTVRFASYDYLPALGVPTADGRWFSSADDRRGAALVAVLSDAYWRGVLGSDQAAIGRTIFVSGVPATIIGVIPPGFRGLNLAEAPDIFLPLHAIRDVDRGISNPFFESDVRGSPTSWIEIVGRLRSGATADSTRAQLTQTVFAQERRSTAIELLPLVEAAVPEAARIDMRQFARLLAGAVTFMLLIGAGTIGMLLLVRMESRRDELMICLALGARRSSLARGVALEGAMLALAGTVIAVPVAVWLLAAMGRFTLPGAIEFRAVTERLDAGSALAIFGSGTIVAIVLSMAAGTVGLLRILSGAIRVHTGGTPRITRRRTRTVFVAAQVAAAVVLLIGATLLARSLVGALAINPTVDARRFVTANVSLGPHGYTADRARLFFDELRLETWSTAVDNRYFSTMGMSIVEGRSFAGSDTATSPQVAIVSLSLARAIAPRESALGKQVGGDFEPEAEIVGVVSDVTTNLSDIAPLTIYHPAQQKPAFSGTVVTRAVRDPAAGIRQVAAQIGYIDPLVSPTRVTTLEEQLRRQMSAQDLGTFVLGGLGTIATLLTLLGAYVVADSMSASRRREFTIRRALGASRVQLGAAVLTDTARLVGIGILAGLLLAWLGAGTIRTFLFRVEPLDPTVLLSVSGAILLIALLVSLRPAMESARVDVTSLLRDE